MSHDSAKIIRVHTEDVLIVNCPSCKDDIIVRVPRPAPPITTSVEPTIKWREETPPYIGGEHELREVSKHHPSWTPPAKGEKMVIEAFRGTLMRELVLRAVRNVVPEAPSTRARAVRELFQIDLPAAIELCRLAGKSPLDKI